MIIERIKPGYKVTIRDRFGKLQTGKAVFCEETHIVLNMGGKHGTPAIATDENIVSVPMLRYKKKS